MVEPQEPIGYLIDGERVRVRPGCVRLLVITPPANNQCNGNSTIELYLPFLISYMPYLVLYLRYKYTSTREYFLISPKTSLFFSFYGGSWSFMLSLSIIFMPLLCMLCRVFRFIHYHCFTQRAPWPWRCECATTQGLPPRAGAGRGRRAITILP